MPRDPASTIDDIPQKPGCYIFRGESDEPLYVGKAADLRSRVRSYFRTGGDGRPLIAFLTDRAVRIETILTKTETEAVLLEDTLIKQFKPPFNLRLKDDKAFYLLRLDPQADFPRLEWVRKRRSDRAQYFGPYASSGALRRTIRFLHSIIPLRDCTDHILNNRSRPCLKHSIGRCSAPCVGIITKEEYKNHVARAVELLQGKTASVRKLMESRMAEAAAALEFERAARFRDQIEALKTTTEAQGVRLGRAIDRDVIALVREGGRVAIQWLPFRGGQLEGGRCHLFTTNLPDDEVLGSFLSQLYYGDSFVPREIFVNIEPSERAVIAGWLATKREGQVSLAVARAGDARRAVEMAMTNAAAALAAREGAIESARTALQRIAEIIGLEEAPSVIDCFDISTLQGRSTVASRVRFVDGVPAKDGYRRYKITSFAGQNDFAAMREVVSRSLRRDVEEGTLPDLIFIDGGAGQLNAALDAREETGAFEVAMAGVAKDRIVTSDEGAVHKGERLFLPGRDTPVPLPPRTVERHFIERIRDEAHRFAITFHRKQRETIVSELDAVPGIGPTRRRELLHAFGSLAELKTANVDTILQKIPRFPSALAQSVVDHLNRPGAEKDAGVKQPGAPES